MKVEYIDHMGDDLRIANVARVSFAKWNDKFTTREEREKGSDEGLLEYLARENHWSPYSHAIIQLRMKAPVPIRTQCFKSKQGFTENEESRRYISSEPELFIPKHFRSKPDGSIKQGSGGVHPQSDVWLEAYEKQCRSSIDLYLQMLEADIAPEQARFVLPQGVYVNWIWTGSLAAFARFYKLRKHATAQGEIQDLAEEVGKVIEPLFPYAWRELTK